MLRRSYLAAAAALWQPAFGQLPETIEAPFKAQTPPGLHNVCESPSAQEAWFRLTHDAQKKPFSPPPLRKDSVVHAFPAEDGRNLVIRQRRDEIKEGTVHMTAEWLMPDGASSLARKIRSAPQFTLEAAELVKLAGEKEPVDPEHPTFVKETLSFNDKDYMVTWNKVVTELKLRFGKPQRTLTCPEAKACFCQ